jgi:hypothetical protein
MISIRRHVIFRTIKTANRRFRHGRYRSLPVLPDRCGVMAKKENLAIKNRRDVAKKNLKIPSARSVSRIFPVHEVPFRHS